MSNDLLIGTELGGHRLAAVIGRGGMGIVYRAEDGAGKTVALKVIAPELSRSGEFRERFLREAESSLDHPHIVPIYGANEQDGHLFLTMLLVDGADLKSLIAEQGRLSPARAATLLAQAADALDFAHANLLVHRDIKPQNLLVEAPGEKDHVFLTDFGLVKRVSAESSFTSTGHIVGSSPYMAPEQIRGAGVDGRSDVYALGCVLYECLTGRPPYQRDEEVSMLWAHVNEPAPKPSAEVGVLGERIDAIVAKAMAKEPDERYLTAGDLAAALAAEAGMSKLAGRSPWVAGRIASPRRRVPQRSGPVTAAARPSRWSFRGLAAGIAALMLTGLAVAGPTGDVGPLPTESEGNVVAEVTDETPASAPTKRERRRTRRALLAAEPLIGADLPRLPRAARSLTGPGVNDVNSAALETIAPVNSAAALSRIVFTSNRAYALDRRNPDSSMDLYLMNADGTGVRRMSPSDPNNADYYPSLSPCGHLTSIRRTDRGLGNTWLRIFNPEPRVTYGPVRWSFTEPLDWAPDCRTVAYHDNGLGGIYLMDPDGSNRRRIYSTGEDPVFSPDGKKIAFAVYTGTTSDIFAINADGSTRDGLATKLTSAPGRTFFDDPVWSPDGKKIAYTKMGASSSTPELWVMDADGSDQRKVAGGAPFFVEPTSWTPDSEFIVFYSNRDTAAYETYRGDVMVVRPDGTGQKDLIPDSGGDEGWLDWQPPVYRTISARIADGRLTGRIHAVFGACERDQSISIHRYENDGWRYIGSTVTSDAGRYSVPVTTAARYRAHLPLSNAKGTLLCGTTDSPGRVAE